MNIKKKRLYEVFEKVNNIKLSESSILKPEKETIIDDFVNYVINELNLDSKPEIIISYDENEASKNKSFGGYSPNDKLIKIILANRNLADALRTLAHEIKHYEQDLNGELNVESGETGSNCENDANVFAGIIMRNYGKINPHIFE